ncbi:MAG: hypothetical protein ACRENE_09475 [Polyangiaceae bacterium]
MSPPAPTATSTPIATSIATSTPTTVATPTPPPDPCGDPGTLLLFVSPQRPLAGQPLHIVAVTGRPVAARLAVRRPGATADAGSDTPFADRQGGPPYYWLSRLDAPATGKWHASFSRDASCGGAELAAKDVVVSRGTFAPQHAPRSALWFTRAEWSEANEDLYAAWIQHLFDAPPEQQPSWNALHEVLRDPSRNFLIDHLGLGEDAHGLVVRPDCADLPYFLRAYFSFKLGLPFGWSHCSRGDNGVPPACTDFATSSDPFPAVDGGAPPSLPRWADPDRDDAGPWEDNVKRFGEFLRTTLADAAQSGAGRTPPDTDDSDYYPVALSVDTLRPGTIFADPYGHVLVVAKRLDQTATTGGVLFAVDGQPDGTVARKRFWRGNFLFAVDPVLGGAGFKRFRPVVRDRITGKLVERKNADLADYSATDQYAGGVEGFYDQMDDVLSPSPLDPTQALLETVQALEEQVRTRVNSVENGRKFLAGAKNPADMPDGAHIFESTGEWEDFSTPSRDLRLLIAIDVARALPARVARRPERYAMPPGKTVDQVRADLEARLARELHARKFEYPRTDETPWELSLEDVAARAAELEMAYNPNDCVEQRWGAKAGSDEASTCKGHAPDAQLAKMATYRPWFHDRKRPPR